MKRKEITKTINDVAGISLVLEGSMTLMHKKSGMNVEVDMPAVFSVVRGTLAWVAGLLEDGAQAEPSAKENMQRLLTLVGESIAYDLSDDEEG